MLYKDSSSKDKESFSDFIKTVFDFVFFIDYLMYTCPWFQYNLDYYMITLRGYNWITAIILMQYVDTITWLGT